jgi:hypothetical protein
VNLWSVTVRRVWAELKGNCFFFFDQRGHSSPSFVKGDESSTWREIVRAQCMILPVPPSL